MSSFDDKRRNLKRPFRKKSLQTGMSVIDTSVDATPLPPASYDTSTHQATTPVRRGIDPHIYEKNIRPAVESLDFARPLDLSRYPWHLAPKGDSANVISRISWDFSAAGQDVADAQIQFESEKLELLRMVCVQRSNTGGKPEQGENQKRYHGPPNSGLRWAGMARVTQQSANQADW